MPANLGEKIPSLAGSPKRPLLLVVRSIVTDERTPKGSGSAGSRAVQ